jgi:membrane associated rhomboid family serine protease
MRKGKVAEVEIKQHIKNDLNMHIGAALIVISVFFGLGFVKRTDFLGLGSLLESGKAFFAAVFGTIGAVWALYLLYLFYME